LIPILSNDDGTISLNVRAGKTYTLAFR
jgi:hypothetical protein